MIEYQKLDVVYTTQWPFNHFQLNEDDYITEEMAQNAFDKKGYFVAVYFEESRRVMCILFRTSSVEVFIYNSSGPYYRYSFKNIGDNYKKISLHSFSMGNISYTLSNENNSAYVVEHSGCLGKDKHYTKKYNPDLRKTISLNFKNYNELLQMIEGIDLEKLLQ